MWMVRAAEGGYLADDFVDKRLVAIGWNDIGDLRRYTQKSAIVDAVKASWPDWSPGKVMNSASQLLRFKDEITAGDRVLTYDSGKRVYHVGSIAGAYRHDAKAVPPYENVRDVAWEGTVDRDALSLGTRNILGSTLTLFKVPNAATNEIERLVSGQVATPAAQTQTPVEEEESSLLETYRSEAFEIVKDRVSRLSWEDAQDLVAGLLRAMGYKTRVSKPGPDRGVDIMASPDGFGFESPRIMVEVKHKNTSIGAPEVRSFLAARHKDDRGLYVSTGGFSKEARYEADRADIPTMLMDVQDLVKAIFLHYDKMDIDSQKLLSLKKIYWPV
jgi:restriction system protein